MVVVKADAYGHGDKKVVSALDSIVCFYDTVPRELSATTNRSRNERLHICMTRCYLPIYKTLPRAD